MANVVELLLAAVQAVKADAPDLAADFAERALRELRGDVAAATEVPWSTDPKDERFAEFVRRALGFLTAFADAGEAGVAEEEARMLSRQFFSEEPRVVGPTFYRTRALETIKGDSGTTVRLTKNGQSQLKSLRKYQETLERHAAIY